MKILLIIPAYNEEASIVTTVENLRAKAPDVDYIVVNDGSSDSTAEICREQGYPFLDLPINLGLAGAFQAGIKYAYNNKYDCAIQFDADGQHLPEYVHTLAEKTTEYDVAIGSRFINEKKPFSLRMFGSFIIEAAIKLTTGKTIKDPTSGMRAFNARTIALLAKGLNMGPEPDTIAYLIKRAGIKVCEVPVTMQDRVSGESYLNLKTAGQYMLRMTTSILFVQMFRKKIGGEGK